MASKNGQEDLALMSFKKNLERKAYKRTNPRQFPSARILSVEHLKEK